MHFIIKVSIKNAKVYEIIKITNVRNEKNIFTQGKGKENYS